MTRAVLVAGASGFHGASVLRALAERTDVEGIGMARSPRAGAALRIADLEDAPALADAVAGVAAVVHCAPYVGYDEERCRRINVDGTARLVEAAAAVGAPVLYISTTGVYGHAPRHGVAADGIVPAPTSVLSASRAEAERIVLAAGGGVLRPHVVVGHGDTRVLPTLLRIRELLGGLPRGGATAVSAIDVRDLGRLVAGVAASDFAGFVDHAVVPAPTTIRGLLELVGRDAGTPIDPVDAVERLAAAGFPPSVAAMTITDEVYDGGTAWRRAGVVAPASVALSAEDADTLRIR